MNNTTVYDAGQRADDTRRYAGPFCTCGDFSCPASDNAKARCVNQEYAGDYCDVDADDDCCTACGEHFSDPHAPGCANTPADEDFDTEVDTATSGGRSTHVPA